MRKCNNILRKGNGATHVANGFGKATDPCVVSPLLRFTVHGVGAALVTLIAQDVKRAYTMSRRARVVCIAWIVSWMERVPSRIVKYVGRKSTMIIVSFALMPIATDVLWFVTIALT